MSNEYGLIDYHQIQSQFSPKHYEQARILSIKIQECKLQTSITFDYHRPDSINLSMIDLFKKWQLNKESQDDIFGKGNDAKMPMANKYLYPFEGYTIAPDYYKRSKQQAYLMLCDQHLGDVFFLIGKYNKAIDCYKLALSLTKDLENEQEIARVYYNMGGVYMLTGDYTNANDAYIHFLKMEESVGSKEYIANGYRSLGNLHLVWKNYAMSLFYYQKTLQLDTTLRLVKETADDYAAISAIYTEYGEYARAVRYCSKAKQLYHKANDQQGLSETNLTLGRLYYKQKNYRSAISFYQRSLAQKKELIDQKGIAIVYSQLSELYANKPAAAGKNEQNLQYALTYGLQAYQIAEELKMPQIITDATKSISFACRKLRNLRSEFLFLEINKQANESLLSKSKAEAIIFAQTELNNKKKQQQIEDLKKQNRTIFSQKQEELRQHKNIFFSLILLFGIGAISAILFWMYTYKQNEIRHQKELSRISMLRLQNIRNSISPHFIFNILNHEINLEENKEKHQELMGLVVFLRRSIEVAEKISVTLAEEVDFVKNYLQIEQKNMDNDFHVLWNIDSRINDYRLFKIPAMVIQISVENALKHALRPKEGEKLLHISILQIENAVKITIQDNGKGYHPERLLSTRGTGTGLKILYQTIHLLNERNSEKIIFNIIDIKDEGASGTRVEITVPEKYNFNI